MGGGLLGPGRGRHCDAMGGRGGRGTMAAPAMRPPSTAGGCPVMGIAWSPAASRTVTEVSIAGARNVVWRRTLCPGEGGARGIRLAVEDVGPRLPLLEDGLKPCLVVPVIDVGHAADHDEVAAAPMGGQGRRRVGARRLERWFYRICALICQRRPRRETEFRFTRTFVGPGNRKQKQPAGGGPCH